VLRRTVFRSGEALPKHPQRGYDKGCEVTRNVTRARAGVGDVEQVTTRQEVFPRCLARAFASLSALGAPQATAMPAPMIGTALGPIRRSRSKKSQDSSGIAIR
jgi:hypothetical protein